MKVGLSSIKFSKGVAIHALVLVVIFAFMMIVIFIIFGGYIQINNCELARVVCFNRQHAHCIGWWKVDATFQTGEPEWREVTDCDENNQIITCQHPDAEMCRQMIATQ